MNYWFTADNHFNHDSIIDYCGRPLSTSQEMDELMIKNWNERVKKSDMIYILGDLCLGNPDKYLDRLIGQKHFIMGNHDRINNETKKKFASFQDIKLIKNPLIEGNKIFLCHYAMRTWHGSFKGHWHLYGHSHGLLPQLHNNAFDVGVDCWDYKPISIEEVCKHMIQLDTKLNIGD